MKIKKLHYEHMEKKVIQLKETYEKEILEHWKFLKNNKKAKDISLRFRWDIFHAAGLTKYACSTLYKYLNDTHIDTALKRITKEHFQECQL